MPHSHTYTSTYLLCTHVKIDCTYSQFLIPGLVDCHIHPRPMEPGTSYNKPFGEWLVEDALPSEQRFDTNQTYARNAAVLIVVGILAANLYIYVYIEPICAQVLM